MPRFPTSAGMALPQIALEESRQTEDRKARKAAMRQALLNTGIGAGFGAANLGLRAYEGRADRGMREAEMAQRAGQFKESLGFQKEQNAPIHVPAQEGISEGDYTPAQVHAYGSLKTQNPLAAIIAASRVGAGDAARKNPFLTSPKEEEGAAAAAMAGAPRDPRLYAEERIAPYGQSLQIGALHGLDAEARREKLALAVGALLKDGVDPQIIEVAVQQLQRAPGGIPEPEPISLTPFERTQIPSTRKPEAFFRGDPARNELLRRLMPMAPGEAGPSSLHAPLTQTELEYLKRKLANPSVEK